MQSLKALTAMLLLSACAQTASSVDVICSLDLPSFTASEAQALTDQTIVGFDLYFEKVRVACNL